MSVSVAPLVLWSPLSWHLCEKFRRAVSKGFEDSFTGRKARPVGCRWFRIDAAAQKCWFVSGLVGHRQRCFPFCARERPPRPPGQGPRSNPRHEQPWSGPPPPSRLPPPLPTHQPPHLDPPHPPVSQSNPLEGRAPPPVANEPCESY